MVLQCPGLFHGEVIIAIQANFQAIVVAIQASNPDLNVIPRIFEEISSSRFNQCMYYIFLPFILRELTINTVDTGISPEHVCATCIKLCFSVERDKEGHIPIDKIGTFTTTFQDTRPKVY